MERIRTVEIVRKTFFGRTCDSPFKSRIQEIK